MAKRPAALSLMSLGGLFSLWFLMLTTSFIKQSLVHVHSVTRPTFGMPPAPPSPQLPDWLPHTPFVEYLQRVQHPPTCSSRKFLVYRMPKINGSDTRNLGAMLTSLWRWVVLALEDDRTVVIDSTHWNMADCPHNDEKEGGLNCYFMPFSSCDMDHVLAAAPEEEHALAPSESISSARSVFRKHRVVKVAFFSPLLPSNETLAFDKGRIKHRGDDCAQMVAVVTYFLRFNPRTWGTISKNLKDSLPLDFNASRTIGIPIRRVGIG